MQRDILVFIFMVIVIQGCKSKYKMYNLLGGDKVDVTEYVEKGYIPIRCDNDIVKLINPDPFSFSEKQKKKVIQSFNKWCDVDSTRYSFKKESFDSFNDIVEYNYTYFMSYLPTDVYSIKINDTISLYFRKEVDSLYLPIQLRHWIYSECDSTN